MRVQVSSMPQYQFDALVLNAILIKQREHMHRKRRQRRRVSFQEPQVVSEVVTLCSSMTPEERAKIWYRQDDLAAFRNEARDLRRKIRSTPEAVEESRGLEHLISSERYKRKRLTIRAIIKAQSLKPDQLPMIASRYSAWAKEIALLVGRRDFYEAYHPELAQFVPVTLPMTQPVFPSFHPKARNHCDCWAMMTEDSVRRTHP